MNRNLIVADDFTGANDTGVQLKRRGFPTRVVFQYGEQSPDDSCVIDTESRGLEEQEAYKKVSEDVSKVNFADYKYVIKKVDSTLRGNVAAEIKALDEAYQSELVLFMPALPDLARTTVDGVHRLNGTPITETELARDPKKPVKEDHIGKILESVYQEPVTLVTLETIRTGTVDLTGGRLFACDAETNKDMQTVLQAAKALNKKILYVGTAAMADNLFEIDMPVKPSMALVASLSSVTAGQVKYAENAGARLVQVPVYEILEGKDPKEYVDEAVKLLREGNDTIVLSSASYDRAEYDKTLEHSEKLGMTGPEVSLRTQNIMGEIARSILQQVSVSGVFLTGGDTAIGLFDKVKAQGSRIMGEVAIGIPIMSLVGGEQEGLPVITKAGAFGKEDAISYGLRKLKEAL
ncbi:MAG TPA: four-carbon acid sugar kinase family protein [Candidatus Blautia gallistercoris]|uniref:Four-carbon acid sugar kinase family protein n=1 Tax=Candidatus Blautia gallistercoris TaxID=2838490 RepID=A0A9D1WK64_9FIRM|nr:four-carbon acid sugar kinase family protein [Candidatus Blautia gallistercoris]